MERFIVKYKAKNPLLFVDLKSSMERFIGMLGTSF